MLIMSYCLISCSKEKDRNSLTKVELTSNNWKQFTGVYGNNYYLNNSLYYYSSLTFHSTNNYDGILSFNSPTSFLPDSGNYIYDEINTTIIWPDIDSFPFGLSSTLRPFYRADWKFQFKNDSMLFFKRFYPNTSPTNGILEGQNSWVVLKK